MGKSKTKRMDALAALRDISFNSASPSDSLNKEEMSMPCCDCVAQVAQGRCPDLNAPDLKGKTPLQYACFMGHEACAKNLIEAGANVNAQTGTGSTPLHFSAMSMFDASAATVAMLTANGADPTITNKAGMTCLDCVKDPERRAKLQRVLKIPAHKFKGRKTKFEKELDEDSDSESEVEEEEPHFGYYDDGGANSDSSDASEEDDESDWEDDDEDEESDGAAGEGTPFTFQPTPRAVEGREVNHINVNITNEAPTEINITVAATSSPGIHKTFIP